MTHPPIPERLLIAAEPFGPALPAARVAAAIARGVRAAGRPAPELFPLEGPSRQAPDVREQLDALRFDALMLPSRAVVVACAQLQERTLVGSMSFEIATRARQAGVPAYAVTARDELDAFDQRMLDLQLVLEACTDRALAAAGKRLAEVA